MASKRFEQERIVGINAVRALIAHRPGAITRVYLRQDRVPLLADFLRERAKNRQEYHVVDDESLERLSESTHHEGVCFFASPRKVRTVDELCRATGPRVAVLLEGVRNPHNLGAIMRIGAHFGVDALIVEAGDVTLSSAAMRTAEGGAESVQLVVADSLVKAVEKLKAAKFFALATSSHEEEEGIASVFETSLPGRVLWMFGSEGEGMSPELMRKAQQRVTIPGTGEVESLNVATAAAICLAFGYRGHSRTPKSMI